MIKSNSNIYCGSFTDDDSGISLDCDYSSSRTRTRTTSMERLSSNQRKVIPLPIPGTVGIQRINSIPLIKFPSDGIVERIRPITMRNSENGDFIICRTNRGTYVAYRTPIV